MSPLLLKDSCAQQPTHCSPTPRPPNFGSPSYTLLFAKMKFGPWVVGGDKKFSVQGEIKMRTDHKSVHDQAI